MKTRLAGKWLFDAAKQSVRRLFADPCTPRRASMIDALEPRRLLTFVYNGTEGDDDIAVYGVPIGTTVDGNDTPDLNIIINLFGGNDRVDIRSLPIGRSVTIRGGLGNDYISAGEGHFASDIDGNIYFEENFNEGNDGIFIVDNGDVNDHDDTHVTASKVYADETLTIDATVHWTSDIEYRHLWLNGGEDDVYLNAIPPGLNISLGLGDDTVLYSPDSHVMFGFVTPATISGSSGDDRLVFYDDLGGNDGRDYLATATTVMNQVISGIEDIDIFTRLASNSPSFIEFTGLPAADAITINGNGFNNFIDFGTQSQPLDLDAASVLLTLNARSSSSVDLWVREDDGVVDPYYFYTGTSPASQRIDHGSFQGIFTDPSLYLKVNASALNDVFNIAGKRLGTDLVIQGGDGNDTVQTANYGGNNHINDLDEIVPTSGATAPFRFYGENGTDTMILNDSADQTNDFDHAYYVGGSWLVKSDQPGYVDFPKLVAYDATTELFSVTASAENNTFTFGGFSTQSFTISGGFGNDLFQSDTSGGLQSCQAAVNISGGNTTDIDTIAVNDSNSAFNSVSEYRFDSNILTYYSGLTRLGSIGFGGSTENFDLFQGSAGTTTRVNVKATAFNLKVLAGAGNDSFHVGGGDFDNNQFTPLNTQLFGEGGIDSIRFDDRTDSVTAGESELLSLDSLRVTKGTKALSYNTFESQIVDAGNGSGGANTIELVNVGSDMTSLTIYGGTIRPTIANIGAGGLLGLLATVNMNRVVGDTLNINDQNDPGNDTYLLTKSSADVGRLVKNFGTATPQTIDFTGVSNLTLNGGTGGKGIYIRGVIQAMPVTINAGSGFDTLRLGNGNVDADLLSPVFVNGGAGNDELAFENMQDTTFESQTLDGLTFTDGFAHTATAVETMYVQNGSGGGTFNLLRSTVYTNFSSSSANQTVNIGNGNLDANILGDVEIATAGNVTVDDRLDTGNDGYTVNVTTFQKTTPGARVINMSNVQAAILQANNGDNNIQVLQGLNNLYIYANGGNDHIDVADTVFIVTLNTINVDTGSENAPSALFGDSISVNSDSGTPGDVVAKVRLIGSDNLAALDVRSGGTFQIPTAVTADLASILALTLSGGTIDLAGGAMIVRNYASSISTVRSYAAAGYAGGAWNGTSTGGAINSSLAAASTLSDAVGYAKSSEISSTFPFTWGGRQVNANDALVRYTYYGDADLNGKVDGADYARIDTTFNQQTTLGNIGGWFNGDFDYNNKVDGADYALIDAAFNSQGAPLRTATAPRGSTGRAPTA